MATKKPENMSFEATIEELDGLVDQLENGDLTLDDALKKFERGIALARASQAKLSEAEQQAALASEANLIEALCTHTSLIKRPVLKTESGFIAGFDETAYRALG